MKTLLSCRPGKLNRATVTLLTVMTLVSLALFVPVVMAAEPHLLFQSGLFILGIATLWCYLRFVLTVYQYTVEVEDDPSEGEEAEALLVITCGTERRMSVMARLSLSDLLDVRSLTSATRSKAQKEKNHHNYAAHFSPDTVLRLTFKDGGERRMSVDIEADEALGAYLTDLPRPAPEE